jgi:carbamate kinase
LAVIAVAVAAASQGLVFRQKLKGVGEDLQKVVVAFGGNAILRAEQRGTAEEQLQNVQEACRQVASMLELGYQVVITHGNGPQVGNILIQNEEASGLVPALPLDCCGAESQGLIGYMIQQSLGNVLALRGLSCPVVTVVTQVVVDEDDPAFNQPSKPVGPFYKAGKAQELIQEKGFIMREDKARGGWRRLVPSPDPLQIHEREAIRRLVDQGVVVIAAGGGGVPVVQSDQRLRGVEAVIDKDLAGQCLAADLEADILLILTDVQAVAVNWGTPDQQFLSELSLEEARTLAKAGHFQAGSMGPKVEAACRFVENGGQMAIIADLEHAFLALQGKAGTRFIRKKV